MIALSHAAHVNQSANQQAQNHDNQRACVEYVRFGSAFGCQFLACLVHLFALHLAFEVEADALYPVHLLHVYHAVLHGTGQHMVGQCSAIVALAFVKTVQVRIHFGQMLLRFYLFGDGLGAL